MAGSNIGAQRMQTSFDYAEPRTPPPAQYASSSKAPAFSTPPGRRTVEFGLDEPRPILRHQSSNVRISSPLRKQVGFEEKPRLRPVLKSSHSTSGSLNGTPDVPRQSLRERRGRARAQVSWAQTIAVPPSSVDYMEEISTARPVNPRRSMDRVSFASGDARSFASSSSSHDGHGRRSADSYARPALRSSRSLSSSIRSGGGRPHSTASTTSAGLWFDIPPPTAPHPSTCMPGFPSVEFHDHRPPKFSRDLLRRPGVVMPKPASRPASIATDRLSAPNNSAAPTRQQSLSRPAGLSRQTSVSKQVGGFFSRKLSKRSASHPPPVERESAPPHPGHPSQRGPHDPLTPRRDPSVGTSMPPPRGSPMNGAPMGGSPMSPQRPGAARHVQWPPQTMLGRFRGSVLPPGAGYHLPPGAGVAHDGSAYPLPPGAMATSPGAAQMHRTDMPTSIQPPAHVLSPHEAARQALRHYRSSPALRVTSPPHLYQVPEMGLPTQWVERVPPPPPSPPLGPQSDQDHYEDKTPDDVFVDGGGTDFSRPCANELSLPDFSQPRPPHLSVDFGSGDLWADLESSFGALSLPDLPGHDDDTGSAGCSDESHTTNATTTQTHATLTATVSPQRDTISDIGHATNTRSYSDVGHTVSRATMSETGHMMIHVGGYSSAGHSVVESEEMYSPPGSPLLRAKSSHRAASESECQPMSHWPSHKLSSSAPGTPLFTASTLHARTPSRSPIPDRLVPANTGGSIRPPPRGESLVASSLGAASSRPLFSSSPNHLNATPRRTSSRSPSSMSLRSSVSMHSEASTISSLPSTITSMTTASSAASVDMPDPIAEDVADNEELAVDVFGIVHGEKYFGDRDSPRPQRGDTPCRQAQFGNVSTQSPMTPESVERAEIRRVERAKSSVATLRVRTLA